MALSRAAGVVLLRPPQLMLTPQMMPTSMLFTRMLFTRMLPVQTRVSTPPRLGDRTRRAGRWYRAWALTALGVFALAGPTRAQTPSPTPSPASAVAADTMLRPGYVDYTAYTTPSACVEAARGVDFLTRGRSALTPRRTTPSTRRAPQRWRRQRAPAAGASRPRRRRPRSS